MRDQSFVSLGVASEGGPATMALLGEDQASVFTIPAVAQRPTFAFRFDNGLIQPGSIDFVAVPGPQPDPRQATYHYRVNYSADTLQVNGLANVPCQFCADVPTQFSHSNVVATLVVTRPRIEEIVHEGGLLRFRFTGEPGYDYFVEFTPILPPTNWQSLTNYRAKFAPIEAVVTDPTTNGAARFYRVRKQDCNCD